MSEQGDKLRALKRGWDSYDANPIKEENISMAEHLADRLSDFGKWQLVPVADGSVQLELHANGWDMEFLVSAYEKPS